MFKDFIKSTELTTDAADQFMARIGIDFFNEDAVFGSTLRALLYNRIPEGVQFNLRIMQSVSPHDSVDKIVRPVYLDNNRLIVCNLSGSAENAEKLMKIVEDGFTSRYPGFVKVDKISVFYRKSFKVVCFVHQECRCSVVFLQNATLQKIHYLCVAIPSMIPWYFTGDNKLKESEIAFLKGFQESTADTFLDYIHQFASGLDMETARLKQHLAFFETRFLDGSIEEAKKDLLDIDATINLLNDQFVQYMDKREDVCVRLLGLERKKQEGGEPHEILDYFIANKKLYLVDTNGQSMRFCVKDYISYFDEDSASEYIKNHRGYFYDGCESSGITVADMEELLTKVFIDQEFLIRVCAAYEFSLNGDVRGLQGFEFDNSFDTFIPNPHIQGYACIGNYRREINSAIVKHDYIYALEQCVASAKSLNFHDSVVMAYFARCLTQDGGRRYQCIELPDGSVMTPYDAIQWLHKQKAQRADETKEQE